MTALHLVHIAPASPERLKKDAYARLLSTAWRIRLAISIVYFKAMAFSLMIFLSLRERPAPHGQR